MLSKKQSIEIPSSVPKMVQFPKFPSGSSDSNKMLSEIQSIEIPSSVPEMVQFPKFPSGSSAQCLKNGGHTGLGPHFYKT